MPRSTAELVELLDLEDIDGNLFRGRQPDTHLQRVFGGQVAAQALIAAARTTPGLHVHSMHSYFLRPGDTSVPIVYDVEKLRDGRSFSTRRVVARQHGRPIYLLSANFQVFEEGLEHQDAMPAVRPPEEGLTLPQLFGGREGDDARAMKEWEQEWAALDVRYLGNSLQGGVTDDGERPSRAQVWVKVQGRLSDDPLEHVATFTYASDMTLISAALVPYNLRTASPGMQVASLDHTIWFHRPFRADEWWLFDQHSPSASGGRGLVLARVFSQSGELVATVAQEGLIRRRSE
ncbi:acyl-CoA thioesterase [Nocardioides daejeonensis]|uniref:acyl-CoA thioesterase n=1 Tax=Nocardioides daejeonensis TaxID=1046556 RepID=UPI000D74068F|nr:acyl-CoA thioesterase II [Nocardioides daejeonensis]